MVNALARFRFSRTVAVWISVLGLCGCGQTTLTEGLSDGTTSPADVETQAIDTNTAPDAKTAAESDAQDAGTPEVSCESDEDCAKEGSTCGIWTCGEAGVCVVTEAKVGESCDDGDPCTAGETCSVEGLCTGGVKAELASTPCEQCSCDPEIGIVCKPAAIGASCNDGDCCTQGDHCQACDPINDPGCSDSGRICAPERMFCEDENPCTADVCTCDDNQIPSCKTQNAADGIECDYNPNDCTTGDHCENGICVIGTPKDLDDANPCTQDICIKGEVVHNPVLDGPCNDGNICTTQDHCYLGTCVGGENLQCTIPICGSSAYCVKDEGCVVEWMPEGAVCNDNNSCTQNDQCGEDHTCKGDSSGCDDFNPCTSDLCEPNIGCSNKANPAMEGMSCSLTTELCGSEGICKEGTCVAEGNGSCDDENPCTQDTCDPLTGCIYEPDSTLNGSTCALGQTLCGDGGICNEGVCEPNNTEICDDDNPCTVDSCDLATGCQNLQDSSTDGLSCGPVTENCGAPGICAAGACIADGEGDCDDQNPCTEDFCGEDNTCQHPPQDVECDDGDPCTDGDTCKEGQCEGAFNEEAALTVNCTQINAIDVAEEPGATKNKCCCFKDEPTGEYKSGHVLDLGEKEPGTSVECCLTPGFSQNCNDVAYFDVSLDGVSWTNAAAIPTKSTSKPGGGWTPFCTTISPDETFRYVRGGNNKCYVDHLVCSLQCGGDPAELESEITTKIEASEDTWLEASSNKGSEKYLIVGRHGTWPKKRSLLRFDTSELTAAEKIISAKMWVYYRYAHQASFLSEDPIDRVIAVHQILVPWSENAASDTKATVATTWTEPLCGINGVDAASTPEDTELWIAADTNEWKSFDITSLVQTWVDDPSNNHGVLLRAENEDDKGRDMRMYSRDATEKDENGDSFIPYLEIVYSP